MAEPLYIEQGFLLAYRLFEVADEIDLKRAIALNKQAATRLKLSREGSQYLQMPNPPVAFLLGPRMVELKAGRFSAELVARLFDHGCVSILIKIPIAPGTTMGQLVALADEIYESPIIEEIGRAETDAVCNSIAGALLKPHRWEQSESYHVVFVQRFRGQPTANEILDRENLTRLLLGEQSPKRVSERERWDVTKHAYSYLDDDLAVVDWNSAFVYEPSGSYDIPDLLEIATAQLLELRYYDDLLDRELARIYDEMESKQRRFSLLFKSEYADLRRAVMVLMLEVAEFTERAENSLKIIGDFYLARVYRAAVRRFRIPSWQESVDRKEALLAQIYALLNGEVESGRMVFLEATIVVLILFEILFPLVKLMF